MQLIINVLCTRNLIDFYKIEQKDIVFLSDFLNENKIIAALHNVVKN